MLTWDLHQGLNLTHFPAGNYMFKVNNRNARTRSETCSDLTKSPERHRLVSLLLTLNRFYTIIRYFYCWLWTRKFRLGQNQGNRFFQLTGFYMSGISILNVLIREMKNVTLSRKSWQWCHDGWIWCHVAVFTRVLGPKKYDPSSIRYNPMTFISWITLAQRNQKVVSSNTGCSFACHIKNVLVGKLLISTKM